jgi:hypothetical protein
MKGCVRKKEEERQGRRDHEELSMHLCRSEGVRGGVSAVARHVRCVSRAMLSRAMPLTGKEECADGWGALPLCGVCALVKHGVWGMRRRVT